MKRTSTPTFSLRLKLLTSKRDENILAYRFQKANDIYNKLISHIKVQIKKLEHDKEYNELLHKERDAKDKYKLNQIRKNYGLTEYMLHAYVKEMQHALKKHIDSHAAQKIATTAWRATEDYLFRDGKQIHFRKIDDLMSIEGKNNNAGIKYKNQYLVWNDLSIHVDIDKKDTYACDALKQRVKYCRIVRLPVGGRYQYYLDLVLEGIPPLKHSVNEGRVGIDAGTLSMAVVSEKGCMLEDLRDGVIDHSDKITRLQQKLDRSRRASNPKNYNEDGTVKKGRKKWKYTNTYIKTRIKIKSLEYKQATSKKMHHEMLANKILDLGDEVYVEDMDYKELQKKHQKEIKGFGRSLENGAPAMLLSIIDRKLGYHGLILNKVSTYHFKASQYDHVKDEFHKKELNERDCDIGGHKVQRDLYSAFLLMNSLEDLLHTDREKCFKTFDQFIKQHDALIDTLKKSDKKLLSSFGL